MHTTYSAMSKQETAFFDVENKFVQLDALIKALNHEAYEEQLTYNTSGLIGLAASLMDELRVLIGQLSP